ncbi:Soluble ligand binding domain-containing protein [Paracoccus nototheniae]
MVSAGIVATGLAGIWAWPIVQNGGLSDRASGLYARLGLGDADASGSIVPPDNSGEGRLPRQAVSESLPPAQVRQPAPAAIVPPECEAAADSPDVTVPGDRIALRIFESSALAAPAGDGAPATDIVFERLDLSGIYDVAGTGTLSLPALGHVDVAGRPLACVEALVSRAAFDAMATQTMVSAAFDSRPPVLVRGAVRAPGSHGYSTGLTVARLLAQAGVLDDRDPAAQVRMIALRARQTELARTRASLSLERMRLRAALDGVGTLPADSPEVTAALALLGAERVTSEETALAAEIRAEGLRQTRTEATLADLAARIETAEQQRRVSETQADYYAARRAQQIEMLQNGFITDSRLDETAMRAMDAERIFLEKHDLLFRLQAERRLAQQDAELAGSERLRSVTAELRSITTALDAADSAFDTVMAELSLFAEDGLRLEVSIERPTDATRTERIAADMDTLIHPGDLVTILPVPLPEDEDLAEQAGDTPPPAPIQSASRE